MAVTLLQGPIASATTTNAFTAGAVFPSNITAGSALLVACSRLGANGAVFGIGNVPTVQSVVDSVGNKYKQVIEGVDATFGWRGFDFWVCERPAAGSAPAVTATLAGFPPFVSPPAGFSGPVAKFKMWLFELGGCGGYELVETGPGFANAALQETVAPVMVDSCAAHDAAFSVLIGGPSTAPTPPAGWVSRVADATQGFYLADKLDTGAASGVVSAAWSGLAGISDSNKGYAAVFALRPGGTQLVGGVRCESSEYNLPVFSSISNLPTVVSPRMKFVPAAGSTVVVWVSPYGSALPAGSLSDDQGNVWSKIIDPGLDALGGFENTMWAARNWVGGAAVCTLPVKQPNHAGAAASFLFFEYANLPGVAANSTTVDLMFGNRSSETLSISALAGDVLFGQMGVDATSLGGETISSGFRSRFTDSNGGLCFVEKAVASAGVNTVTWTYDNAGPGTAWLVALTPAPLVTPTPAQGLGGSTVLVLAAPSTFNVVGTYRNVNNQPSTGSVVFTPARRSGGGGFIVAGRPITVPLVAGALSASLNVLAPPLVYKVREHVDGTVEAAFAIPGAGNADLSAFVVSA